MDQSNNLICTEKCTGCGLCAVTSNNAVTMQQNEEGFMFPVKNREINRNEDFKQILCTEKNSNNIKRNSPLHVYACQILNQKLLIEATAGGFFPLLAEEMLNRGGVVFGAAYDANMRVVHIATHDMAGIKKFNGSKYVQSDITLALKEAKGYLHSHIPVLFTGTPCQIAALLCLCSEEEKKYLLTMDVPCYGVPSPGLFRKYIDIIEKHYSGKVFDFRFRDKHNYGWSHTTVIRILNEDGSILTIEEPEYSKIAYFKMFGARNCFRKACYQCKYTTIERISDITTGNFWGIESISEKFDCHLGVSMVLTNTEKGSEFFYSISDKMVYEERTIDEAITANAALVCGCNYPKKRDKIYQCFIKCGFEKMIQKYYTENLRTRVHGMLSTCKRKLMSRTKS